MTLRVLFLILTLLLIPQQQIVAVELVVNKNNPIESISLDKVRYIFLMRVKKWENGETIDVYVNDWESELHSKFCREILEVIPHRINNSWERKKYSGMGDVPDILSEAEMIDEISSNVDGIGYVDKFTEEMSKTLKVLRVE